MKKALVYSLFALFAWTIPGAVAHAQDVVINEVAWMGTTGSTSDEWIELHNTTGSDVDVSGWTLAATDGTPSISLSGTVPAHGYFLLERTDDSTVPGIAADQIYTGALGNGGEVLELRDDSVVLIDEVDAWYAGDNTSKATMSRVDSAVVGTVAANWATAALGYAAGYGTPDEGNMPGYSDSWFAVYFSDHTNTVLPGATGPSVTAEALIDAIDASQDSIEFALYGVGGAQGVIDALADAVSRGVTVRGVVDSNTSGYFPYRDTQTLIDALPPGSVVVEQDDLIMHNKFFVFDEQYVWTGSANVSDTGLYVEYNGNWSILVDHADLAAAYLDEFEEMYAGDFHTDKTDNTQHTFPALPDGSVIESYFAPTDDAETNAIVRAIDDAATSLDIRIFYFTSAAIRDAVLDAEQRGVAVRVIIDASGADSEYSVHEALRTAGIPVKVEDWPGKEHMKALVADEEVVIIGSQNWTESGNIANDENTLYIKNGLLAEAMSDNFDAVWADIPNTWLSGNPGAESLNTPGSTTDFLDNDHDGLTDEGAPEALNTIESGAGAINVYFNKSALTGYHQGSPANHNVNLEERLIARIDAAINTLDIATYELNLPDLRDALLDRAANGVQVRLIADAKDYEEGESDNYDLFVLTLEILRRGEDGTVGTGDDVALFADSPIFAVEDTTLRTAAGLPSTPTGLSSVTYTIGTQSKSGYLLAEGEKKNSTDYYSPGPQMHNKFVVLDDTWVWTGSWNFTENGLYGTEENRLAGILGGNTNHAIELNSPNLATIYTDEFEEMWGSSTATPDPNQAAFHGRKVDNTSHVVAVGGRTVEVYFSPGDDALDNITQYVIDEADVSASFCIFAWSDQLLLDELKLKFEGSKADLTGSPTGFVVEGVYDSVFWNQWWSASVDMTGRTASQTSTNNPNTRWANPADAYKDGEDTILHHKYMVIDGHTASDPAVISGSTNWSANGDDTNDENLLIIHDDGIADQFMQEFRARHFQAGGALP